LLISISKVSKINLLDECVNKKQKVFLVKGVLNPNFRPFSFELDKKHIFYNEF